MSTAWLSGIFLLLILVAFLALLVNPRTRWWALGGMAVVLLFLFFVTWEMMLIHKQGELVQIAQNSSRPTVRFGNQEPAELDNEPRPESAIIAESIDPNLPTWATEPPKRIDDSYFVVVKSGSYSDPNIRDEMLDKKMVAAAEKYIDERLYRSETDVSKLAGVDANYLRENCVKEQYPAEGEAADEIYVRLELDRRFRDVVEQRYRQALTARRVQQSGYIVAGILGALGAALVYLKATTPRKPGAGSEESKFEI